MRIWMGYEDVWTVQKSMAKVLTPLVKCSRMIVTVSQRSLTDIGEKLINTRWHAATTQVVILLRVGRAWMFVVGRVTLLTVTTRWLGSRTITSDLRTCEYRLQHRRDKSPSEVQFS